MQNTSGIAVGIDFGTTNSSVGFVQATEVELISFPFSAGTTESFRSVLYLQQHKERGRSHLKSWTGPAAIETYLAAENKGRLMQSLKSYLPNRDLKSTEVFGKAYTFEDLVARILGDLRQHTEHRLETSVRHVTVGRPVNFVGAETEEDNQYAVARLRNAFLKAGFESVDFEMEPVAAAYYYESTLDHDELILIGDFGGGTSDFSLLHVGPSVRRRGRRPEDLLGNSGVGLAGDAFDAKIVRKLVSPRLGAEATVYSMKKHLPAVPNWIFTRLEHWHHLSFLQSRNLLDTLKRTMKHASDPEAIEALIFLIEEDLGYQLHQAVQRVKCKLSESTETTFHFKDGGMNITAPITRTEFESWIIDELSAIERCVDSLLENTGVLPKAVDRIFLTGGSSLVPAVRRIFESRFGADRVRSGNEFTSVARGLTLRAAEASRQG